MVLLIHKLPLFNLKHKSSKLDSDQPLSIFRSHVTNSLLRLSPAPEFEFISLKWLHSCLNFLHTINNVFAKLVVAIDYPMNKWESYLVDEYLNYTHHFLQFLNLISSSVSKLGESRILLAHGLSLIGTSPPAAVDRMKGIRWNHCNLVGEFKLDDLGKKRDRICSGKEFIIHEALLVMESVGLWVCGIILSGLSGNDSPFKGSHLWLGKSESDVSSLAPVLKHKETDSVLNTTTTTTLSQCRKDSGESDVCNFAPVLNCGEVDSLLNELRKIPINSSLESVIGKVIMGKGVILKEVKEVIEAVNRVVFEIGSGNGESTIVEAAMEVERGLKGIEDELKGIGDEVNSLFSKVMIGRNELLESLRRKKK